MLILGKFAIRLSEAVCSVGPLWVAKRQLLRALASTVTYACSLRFREPDTEALPLMTHNNAKGDGSISRPYLGIHALGHFLLSRTLNACGTASVNYGSPRQVPDRLAARCPICYDCVQLDSAEPPRKFVACVP
jgi:hypothetical protein